MILKKTTLLLLFVGFGLNAQTAYRKIKSTGKNSITLIKHEAENFIKQSKKTKKFKMYWYKVSKNNVPQVTPDTDKPHYKGASNGTYLELLPEKYLRKNKLKEGINFSTAPGKMNILTYEVNFKKPGRYYVWVRAFATNLDDNSIHVGINDTWKKSGTKLYWCQDLKDKWAWSSHQRGNNEECLSDSPRIYIDVPSAGKHKVQFSMREPGFEFDCFVLTQNKYYRIK